MHERGKSQLIGAVCYDETHEFFELFFFWNRIPLDLNYSRLAGTSLTVITEMF